MAVSSRSRPRKADQSASQHARDASRPQLRESIHTNHAAPTPASAPSPPPSPPNDNEPPAKRRKLSIRSKHADSFAPALTHSPLPKPPTRISISQPHGRLVQTINGVQRELDADEDELSLPTSGAATPQPRRVPRPALPVTSAAPAKPEDKRTLRSQDDGPRLKSELAIYFPNYEDIIFDAPKDAEFITVDSSLYITDNTPKVKSEQSSPVSSKGGKNTKTSPSHARKTSANGIPPAAATPQRSSSNQFNGSPSLNLDVIARGLPDNPQDPLTDEYFLKSHRRAERKEKQLRNIEKERAMHEKVQLDRLLEGLQGHDWLKVLGITGVTDGEAKKYEPKRDYFITEVQALVDKFKEWKEEERRQKLEKDTPAVAVSTKDESEEPSEEGSVGPPSSDLNASAARQLQQETAIALKSIAMQHFKPSNKGKEPAATSTPKSAVPYAAPSPEVPFTSFYDKPHLRDAALGKARHGRNVTAFGHPVPEVEEREFELPDEYATEDAIRANAREKRRRKRESAANSGSG